MRAAPPKRGGKPSPPSASALRRTDVWICLAIIVATLTVYSQVRHYEFINFDDPEYVGDNIHVRAGLTASGVAWALHSFEAANWFPLTWLSHMIDYQLFGMDSGWSHLTNVWLHALSALLLYAVLLRMTSARWPSASVAFLFALHPLHVESVAWIAERKDILCALFWFLTMWFYARYVERPGVARYLMTAAAFGLGLMSKPMIVTLPFVLLLLDVWPLGRAEWPWKWNSARSLLIEKLPFLAMAAGGSALTVLAQRAGGAVAPLAELSLSNRIGNALLSYVAYIRDMFWPSGLALLYPLPRTLPVAGVAAAGAALAAISVLAAVQFRKRPYLAIGWFWYLGTLVPVIGLVQVGTQARADRYTYIPLIGLFLMLAWGAAELAQRVPRARKAVVAAAALACSGCVAGTWFQIQYWASSETLFRHSLEVAEAPLSHNNLGNALMAKGQLPEAIREFRAALRLLPRYADAHFNLGIALENLAPSRSPERLSEAIAVPDRVAD
jgi:tetratricopeptide (TPR) repeat protein